MVGLHDKQQFEGINMLSILAGKTSLAKVGVQSEENPPSPDLISCAVQHNTLAQRYSFLSSIV